MFGLGMNEIAVVLVLALIFLGPKMLPDIASGFGKVIREVRKATADIKNEIQLDEAIRKPLEELREATMLPPEELKRRDEERAMRAKWDQEEKERLEREEKERVAAEETEAAAKAAVVHPLGASDRTIAMDSPPAAVLEAAAASGPAPTSPTAPMPSAPTSPLGPPVGRAPAGAVPRSGPARHPTANPTIIGNAPPPSGPRAMTPPPPLPPPSGSKLPPPRPTANRGIPVVAPAAPAPDAESDEKKV